MRIPEWMIYLLDSALAALGPAARESRSSFVRSLLVEALRETTGFFIDESVQLGPTGGQRSQRRPGDPERRDTRLVQKLPTVIRSRLDDVAGERHDVSGVRVSRTSIIEYAILLGLSRRGLLPSLDLGGTWNQIEGVITRAGMIARVEWERYFRDDLLAFAEFPHPERRPRAFALNAPGRLQFLCGKRNRWRCVTEDGQWLRHGSGVWLPFGADVVAPDGSRFTLPEAMGRYRAVPATFLWLGDISVAPRYFLGDDVVELLDTRAVQRSRSPFSVAMRTSVEGLRVGAILPRSRPDLDRWPELMRQAHHDDALHLAGFLAFVPGQEEAWKKRFVWQDRSLARIKALRHARAVYQRSDCESAVTRASRVPRHPYSVTARRAREVAAPDALRA